MMQDMDTLAPAPDDTSDLEVIFISTPNNNGLQVHTEDFLLSKGGSAPVELDDTASEDEEQDHGAEIEVTVPRCHGASAHRTHSCRSSC